MPIAGSIFDLHLQSAVTKSMLSDLLVNSLYIHIYTVLGVVTYLTFFNLPRPATAATATA